MRLRPFLNARKRTQVHSGLLTFICLATSLMAADAQTGQAKEQSFILGNKAEASSPNLQHLSILRDGPSWYFQDLQERVLSELQQLREHHRPLQVVIHSAEGRRSELPLLLKQSIARPELDVCLTLGSLSSHYALELSPAQRLKPIITGALLHLAPEGVRNTLITSHKIKNLSFTSNPQRIENDLTLLKRLSGQSQHLVLVDRDFYHGVKERFKVVQKSVEQKMGLTLTIQGCGPDAQSILDDIPKGTTSIYVSRLSNLAPEQRRKLFSALAQRGIYSVAMLGVIDVQLGALAGLATDHRQVIARRLALNAHLILEGQKSSSLPLILPASDHLLINAQSAKQIGFSPDYNTTLEAEFIHPNEDQQKSNLNLQEAMKMAKAHSDAIQISQLDEQLGRLHHKALKTALYPRVDLHSGYSYQHTHHPLQALQTPERLQNLNYGLRLRQALFSDEVQMNLKSSRHNIKALSYERQSQELDTMASAAAIYLQCLRAQKLLAIEKDNLRLTEHHLNLAKLRKDIGSAESSEVYRWEQNRAMGKKTLFQRAADLRIALVELNRILRADQNSSWVLEDIELNHQDTYFMQDTVLSIVERKDDFERFKAYLAQLALTQSPELKAFDQRISQQGVVWDYENKPYRLPDLNLMADLSNIHRDSSFRPWGSQREASVQIQFNWSLFEGGHRNIRASQEKLKQQQLLSQRRDAMTWIEQKAWTYGHRLGASHVGIRLSREALAAAEKNYNTLQDKYSQGLASILDLLDAQQALLSNRQQAEMAVYDYLDNIHLVQRSIAWFEWEQDLNARREWAQNFKIYMTQK